MPNVQPPTPVSLLGIPIHPLRVAELNLQIAQIIEEQAHALVLNVNVHAMNLAFEHAWLRDLFQEARIVFCDGAGVRLGARILGHDLPERVTYADWMWQLGAFCSDTGYSLFFLGGKPDVAYRASLRLKERFPRLRIVGTHHGFFDKTPGSSENQKVIEDINAQAPNVLIVGFGMPLQERWLLENWRQLDANVCLTGGAVFDYISGSLTRPPMWMNEHGPEWLGRFIIEPRRLWRRYMVGNPIFLWRVLREKFCRKSLQLKT